MEDFQDVTIRQAGLNARCDLYAYSISETQFDDLALASYFASGKFDKASMHRWSAGRLLTNPHKAQNFRASVDNTVMLLPVGALPPPSADDTDIEGSVVIVGFHRNARYFPVCIGVATSGPFALDRSYAANVLPVHVLTTLCGWECDFESACEHAAGASPNLTWKQHPRLPDGVHMLLDDLPDAAFEARGIRYDSTDEYARRHIVASGFAYVLEKARGVKTPSPSLELERLARLDILKNHLVEPRPTLLPPTRRNVGRVNTQRLDGVMATYEKYASMFGRILV